MLGNHASSSSRADLHSSQVELTLAWGIVAECVTSLACPVVIVGALDVSATALNVVGPLLAGIVHALDEALGDARWHRYCTAFQVGFVGVFTSFTFMTEQAATLASRRGSSLGAAYIVASLAAGVVAFRVGAAAMRRVARRRGGALRVPSLGSPRQLVRQLGVVVALAWVWVLLSPAGAVHDPLLLTPYRAAPSKWVDIEQLALGMLWLSAGLHLSRRVGDGASSGLVQWGPLRANVAACALLVLLRAAEGTGFSARGSLVAAKLRTAGCGALSTSGGLAVAHGTLFQRGRRASALVNFALHAYLASATGVLLPASGRHRWADDDDLAPPPPAAATPPMPSLLPSPPSPPPLPLHSPSPPHARNASEALYAQPPLENEPAVGS